MKAISVFNNKGGVGKTTLVFHLGHALANSGYKTLMLDLDPQCNLSLHSLDDEQLREIWTEEDEFVDDFAQARSRETPDSMRQIGSSVRTAHFMLKPTEDGVDDLSYFGAPVELKSNLHMIPGRLTLHMFEEKLSQRWTEIYRGDPLAIRTITKIRDLIETLSTQYGYDYVLIDTSPSLGTLNKVVISTSDGVLIPCAPDMFSLYGIRNIGKALSNWKREFDTVFRLISSEKRAKFPAHFVQLIGYSIVNAKKFNSGSNPLGLANAHYSYARRIPEVIQEFISAENRKLLTGDALAESLGKQSIMYTYNTFPSMAQKYRTPMWDVPRQQLDPDERGTILGNRAKYEETLSHYSAFADAFVERINNLPN